MRLTADTQIRWWNEFTNAVFQPQAAQTGASSHSDHESERGPAPGNPQIAGLNQKNLIDEFWH